MKHAHPFLFAAAVGLALQAGLAPAQPADAPALADQTLDQLLNQLQQVAPSSPQAQGILKEITSRGDVAYTELLKHFNARDRAFVPATTALLTFPKFGDVLLNWTGPNINPPPLVLLERMKAQAVPALLRQMASPQEGQRAIALEQLLVIGRYCPDEADRQFTPILTAPADIKPRLLAAQGLVTGLWPRDAQEAVVQQLAKGDAAMVRALLQAISTGGLPLDEAAPAWTKALQAMTDPTVLGNLLQASAALRTEDMPVPALVGFLKNLKPGADSSLTAAVPAVIAALKRAGKPVVGSLPELLKSTNPVTRDAAIELCKQLDADAAPVAVNLATMLETADFPADKKPALLAALAAIGPGARIALPAVQRITDPALADAKRHAALLLVEGWTPPAVPDWKPARIRRVRFAARPTAGADLLAAMDAVSQFQQSLADGIASPAPALPLWGAFALAGDADSALNLIPAGALTPPNTYWQSKALIFSAATQLRAGKKDAAADLLTKAIGRYRLARMISPGAQAGDMEFSDMAIAQLATGDVDAMIRLVATVPVNRMRVVQWEGAHQDLDGALETAMAVPFDPNPQERINALAAAGNAFALAGRAADAGRAFGLALDALHARTGLTEFEISGLASAVAVYADNGVTPIMLRGFFGPDDKDLSSMARAVAIDQMIGRGLLDQALALAMAAPPMDPNADPVDRLARISTFLHPALAMGAGARRADVAAFCERMRKELEALYDAGAKRPTGRDMGFSSQYFSASSFLAQTFINAGQPREAAAFLDKNVARLVDVKSILAGSFDSLAGTIARQQAEARNVPGAQNMAKEMDATFDAVLAWCAIGEAQYAQDRNAAEKSWARAQTAGAGPQAQQALANINNTRARAAANAPPVPVIQIYAPPRATPPVFPPSTQPTGPQGKAVEDAAKTATDPAARLTLLASLMQQYVQSTPQTNPLIIDRRLPAEYPTLMRESEAKLTGNAPEVLLLRAQTLDACILAGLVDGPETRGPALAKAVAAAPDINAVAQPVLKSLATAQGAAGRAVEAQQWIDKISDAALRAQLRFAVLRGAILRVSDVLLVSQ